MKPSPHVTPPLRRVRVTRHEGIQENSAVRVLELGNMVVFEGIDDLVVAIHAATAANGQRFSFAVTGGGARARPLQFQNFILNYI